MVKKGKNEVKMPSYAVAIQSTEKAYEGGLALLQRQNKLGALELFLDAYNRCGELSERFVAEGRELTDIRDIELLRRDLEGHIRLILKEEWNSILGRSKLGNLIHYPELLL